MVSYNTNINSNLVTLDFTPGSSRYIYNVAFHINGDFAIDESLTKKDKLKITKWLLEQFNNFVEKFQFDLIVCSAFDADNLAGYREKIYKKIGFTYTNEDYSLIYPQRINGDINEIIKEYNLESLDSDSSIHKTLLDITKQFKSKSRVDMAHYVAKYYTKKHLLCLAKKYIAIKDSRYNEVIDVLMSYL